MSQKKIGLIVVLILAAVLTWRLFFYSTLAGSANLQVCTNTAPATATRGNMIGVSDIVTNTSTTVQAGASVTCLFLNTNHTIVGASNLGTHTTGAIGPKGKISWSGNVTVPAGQSTGTNYFITVCDCHTNVPETNENDNTNTCVIVIN